MQAVEVKGKMHKKRDNSVARESNGETPQYKGNS